MTEENTTNQNTTIDTDVNAEQVKQDIVNDKVKAIADEKARVEAELAKYKQAEIERNKTEAEKDAESKLQARLKQEREAIEASFNDKLETLSKRVTTTNTADGGEKLTREEYDKNKKAYDTMLLKEMLPTVFNK